MRYVPKHGRNDRPAHAYGYRYTPRHAKPEFLPMAGTADNDWSLIP